MEWLIVVAWGIGTAFAVGVPAVLVAVGLSHRGPTRRLPNGARVRGEGPSDEALLMAMDAFLVRWEERGFRRLEKVEQGFSNLLVIWEPGDAFSSFNRTVRGVAETRKKIRVAERNGAALGSTAIFDELMHVALWWAEGDPDREHKKTAHREMVKSLKRDFR